MLKYLKYVIFDLKNSILFKIVYIIEKFIKIPFLILNQKFKFNFKIPYLFKKDFIIENSDWKFLIKAYSWNDYIISSYNEFELRDYFLWFNDWIFLDIWAHIWKRPISICNKNKKIFVYSFEPNPDSFEYLNKNIKLNNLQDNIKSYNFWIWNKNWELYFKKYEESAYSHFVYISESSILQNIIKVEVCKIDDFIEKNHINIKKINLIKIDTEWFELNVIEWMDNLLKNSNKNMKIICEITKNKDLVFNKFKIYWFNCSIQIKDDYIFDKK